MSEATPYVIEPAETLKRWAWRDSFSKEELASLREMQDWRSWLSVLGNWAIVFAAMALVARWPNPLTVLLALFLIGARQLGMAVLMHEASHFSLFSSKKVNDAVGTWLCAYPVWSDLHSYRNYHMGHHARTWTRDDPDLALAQPFPVTAESLRRKIWRDLSGQTGWKRAKYTLKRDLGLRRGTVPRSEESARAFHGMLVSNALLLALLTLLGHPALYLLWVAAWFTTNMLVTRIRAIAEHSMITDPSDPFQNTRTTVASWLERLFLAPNGVNYHLEHHLLMTVPHYRLREMHELLRARGLLDGANVVTGYREVLRRAASKGRDLDAPGKHTSAGHPHPFL
ncbi:MAG: fatty acid desaturase family protein [Myxococcales bacterium]|nr:fatty acid desaturase family protein [Myxococcales bacterium]